MIFLADIGEHVALSQLMDSFCNVNHDISVVGYWIFDSNYKKTLVLNRESLYIICALSYGEEQVADFELVHNAVGYICLDARLKEY